MRPQVGDDLVERGVQQRLATAEGDDVRSQSRKVVNARFHGVHRDGFGEIVELVAVLTRQITTANGNDVRHDGMVGRDHSFGDHHQFAHTALRGNGASADAWVEFRHIEPYCGREPKA